MGDYLLERATKLKEHPTVGDVRGKGLMVGLEFVKDQATKEPLDPKVKYHLRVAQACLERGMYIEYAGGCDRGRAGDMVMFGPPFIVTRDQIDEMVGILDQALTAEEKILGLG
jgi:adenosylmethionine-8-amino-7-oxononanoate aminotransferase